MARNVLVPPTHDARWFYACVCCTVLCSLSLPVTLISGAALPVPCPPIGTTPDVFMMQSNNVYTLSNCNQTVVLAVNNGASALDDVQVFVQGGTAYPFVRLTPNALLHVHRFVLHIQGVNRTVAASTHNVAHHVGPILAVNASVTVDGLEVRLVNSVVHAVLPRGNTPRSLVHVSSATLGGTIVLNVSQSTIVASDAWASLLLVATVQTAAAANTMLTVDMADSMLSMRTTEDKRYLVEISGMLFPTTPSMTDSLMAIRIQRCTIAIVVDCMDAVTTTYVGNAAIGVALVGGVGPSQVRGFDVALVNTSSSIVVLRPTDVAVSGDTYVVYLNMDWDLLDMRGAIAGRSTIALTGGDVWLHGSRKTAAVCFDSTTGTAPVHHVHVEVASVHVHQIANGTIDGSSGAVVCSVCYVMDSRMSVAASVFTFRNLTVWHVVQTGPLPRPNGELPSTQALIFSSEFFMLWSTMHHVEIDVEASVLYADVRNGTVPFSPKAPGGIAASIGASFVRMRQGLANATNLTLRIRDGIVVARMGFLLTPGAIAAIVSSHVAAALLVGNCTQCQVVLEDIAVQVLAMDFPKPLGLAGHIQTQNLGFVNFLNFTSILQTFDVAPLFLAIPFMQQAYGVFNPNVLMGTHISIRRIAVWYPVAEQPLGGDCIMVLGIGNVFRNGTVVMEGGVPQFSVAVATTVNPDGYLVAGQRTVVAPLHAIMTFVVADVADATFSISGYRNNAPVSKASSTVLLSLLSGGFTPPGSGNAGLTVFVRCRFTFVANTVAENLWFTVLPTGNPIWVYGGASSWMQFDHTTVYITNNSFLGFTGGGLVGANALWVVPQPTAAGSTPPTHRYGIQPVLRLGCNLWNHAPLDAAVHVGPVWRYLIEYPPSTYNASIACLGWVPTSTATASAMPPTPRPILESLVSAPVRATGALATVSSFVSLQASGVRGSMPALQAAVGSLRVWQRCALASPSGTGNGGNDDDEEAYVAADWMENPLRMQVDGASIPPVLAYGVGAVIGNTVLVALFGATMHGLAVARRLVVVDAPAESHDTAVSPFVRLLRYLGQHFLPEAAYLPGTITASYAIMLEPTASAAVALIGHYSATSTSMGIGVLFVGIWVGVLVAFVVRIVQHGGLNRATFDAQCIPVSGRRRRRPSETRNRARVGHMLLWLQPSAVWSIRKLQRGDGRSDVASARHAFLYNYGGLFDVYRPGCHLYFAVELSSAVVNGIVIGAALSVPPADACGAAQSTGWVLAALACVQLVAYAVVRPFSAPIDNVVVVVSTVLALSVHVCSQLQGDGSDEGAAGDGLMMAASIFQIVPLLLAIATAVLCDIKRKEPQPAPSSPGGTAAASREADGGDGSIMRRFADTVDLGPRGVHHSVSTSRRLPSSPHLSNARRPLDDVHVSDDITDYLVDPPSSTLSTGAPPVSLEALISMICSKQQL